MFNDDFHNDFLYVTALLLSVAALAMSIIALALR